MKKDKRFKANEDSTIEVKEMVRTFEKDGQKYIQTKWTEIDQPINLGSLANPNKRVLGIKITVPHEKKGNPLAGLFGG